MAMEVSNNWQSWQPQDKDLESLLQPGFSTRMQPHHPLMKLKRNLFINTVWGVLITIGYLVIMATTSIWPVLIALGTTSLFNIIILLQSIKLYRSIQTIISPAESVLSISRKHYKEITAWCKMQNKLALWVYPVAATGGYIYGGVLSSGKTFEELVKQPLFIWALPVTLAILVPLSYLLARWMARKAFGIHLDNLKATILSLEG
jgi:predicted neutral ceramidase superfamily lipid hydrolase